jgi:hypothetical protein
MSISTMKNALLITAAAMLLVPSALRASDGVGSEGAGYLTLPVGARSIAMGEARATGYLDPYGWLANPASLQMMNMSGIGLFHAESFFDARYENMIANHTFSRWLAIGFGIVYQHRPDIQGYDEFAVETGMLQNYNYQAMLGISTSPIENMSVGVNLKYFDEKLDQWSAGGFGADLGAIYSLAALNTSIGFSVQNLGEDVKFITEKEPLPLTMRFGAEHRFEATEQDFEFSLAWDIVKPRFEDLYLSAGCELEIFKMLAVRGGWCGRKDRAGDGLSLGAGATLKDTLKLDYAWTSFGDLGSHHSISLYFGIF